MADNTVGSQIAFMPGVNSGVKSALRELFGSTDATELACKQPKEIVPQIAGALPDENAVEIALKLLKFLSDMGFGASTTATVKDEPQRVIVEMPTALADRNTRDLLDMLSTGEGETSDVLALLMAKPEVAEAARKANGKIVVPTDDGKIDSAATHDYIKELNLPFSESQRKVNEKFPVTLDQALNLIRFVTLNPLTLKVNYVGVRDTFGVIISNLPDERYFALLWALLTDHPRMPRTTDEDEIETYLEQIFADDGNLKRRWKVIFEDYAEARQNGDAMTQGLVRQMTEDQAVQLLGRLGGPRSSSMFTQPQPAAVDYEALVREQAQLAPSTKRVAGNSTVDSGGICEYLYVGGNSNRVQGTIVLNGGEVTGNSCTATVYAPPRVTLSDRGNSNRVQVINVTWKRLYEILRNSNV